MPDAVEDGTGADMGQVEGADRIVRCAPSRIVDFSAFAIV